MGVQKRLPRPIIDGGAGRGVVDPFAVDELVRGEASFLDELLDVLHDPARLGVGAGEAIVRPLGERHTPGRGGGLWLTARRSRQAEGDEQSQGSEEEDGEGVPLSRPRTAK